VIDRPRVKDALQEAVRNAAKSAKPLLKKWAEAELAAEK